MNKNQNDNRISKVFLTIKIKTYRNSLFMETRNGHKGHSLRDRSSLSFDFVVLLCFTVFRINKEEKRKVIK